MKKALKRIIKKTGLRRHQLAAARMFCERHSLAAIAGAQSARVRSGGRVLCYHSVGQAATGVNDVSPERFRRQIELALQNGFRFVPAKQIAQSGGGPKDLAITFDDAWSSVSSKAAPILRDFGIPWMLFVVSSWSDHREAWARESILPWRDIDRLMAKGAEIGSHSVTHPDFGSIARAQMVDELSGSRQAIEQRLGVAPATFAIPFGQSMNWPPAASELAREAGYEFVYAQAEETRPDGTIPRTFVTCFDDDRIFSALLNGAYDRWEEWV
jgi:peptidoglycan/xylan/chitin deacetylase (PgdA/CDA1 family)